MRRYLALLAAALLLTACSTSEAGNPSPAGSPEQPPPASTGEQLPSAGAPKVEHPIDTSQVRQTPCAALTAAEVASLLGSGIKTKPDLNAPAGPACSWHSPTGAGADILVIFSTVTDDGMTAVYRQRGTGYPFFLELAPIDGHPIVAYGPKDLRASRGECQIAIGTSDQQTVDIGVTQSDANVGKKDPCDAAHDIAGKVLANIKGSN